MSLNDPDFDIRASFYQAQQRHKNLEPTKIEADNFYLVLASSAVIALIFIALVLK